MPFPSPFGKPMWNFRCYFSLCRLHQFTIKMLALTSCSCLLLSHMLCSYFLCWLGAGWSPTTELVWSSNAALRQWHFHHRVLLFFYWHFYWHSTRVCKFVTLLNAQLNTNSCQVDKATKVCATADTWRCLHIAKTRHVRVSRYTNFESPRGQHRLKAEVTWFLKTERAQAALASLVSQLSHWWGFVLRLPFLVISAESLNCPPS